MPQRAFQAGLKAVGFAGAGDGSCGETLLRKLHQNRHSCSCDSLDQAHPSLREDRVTCTWSEMGQENSGRAESWAAPWAVSSLQLIRFGPDPATDTFHPAQHKPSEVTFTAQGSKPTLLSRGGDIFHTWVLAELLRMLLCSTLTAEISKFSFSVLEYRNVGSSFQGGGRRKGLTR